MTDIAKLLVLHDLMDCDDEKPPQRENKKMGEKEKREGILQQHHKRVKDRRSRWI